MTKSTIGWTLLGTFVVLSAAVGLIDGSRSDYYTWRDKRAAWHQRCDAYVGPVTAANREDVKECQRQLADLLAEANAKGWNR